MDDHDEIIHQGEPRAEGRGGIHAYNPGVPRVEGRGMQTVDGPGVPRSEGQDLDRNSPGVPRLGRGHDLLDLTMSPGVPRQGRGQDLLDLTMSPGVPRQGRGHDIPDLSCCSRKRNQDNSGQRRSRRRHRSSSSEESGERYHTSLKRPRPFRSHNDSNILDKVLSILNHVKSSDKPKLTFNSNVVPDFDPMSKEQTVLTWLTKVEECASIYGWDDRETIHYALPKLTGVAKTWYQGLPSVLFTWTEWKKKLIESFPCREDYAELLTDMLAKRVRYGESLEQYYYAKVNLLNRCQIYGKKAVDCILYGVEDRAVKVGAQAAQFSEPERVLKYFKTVKVGQIREKESHDSSNRFRNERRSFMTRSGSSKDNPTNTGIKCYNCNEIGHRSTKCDKPAVKCTYCEKLGHLVEHCYKNKLNKSQGKDQIQDKDKNEKQVARLSIDNPHDYSTNNKKPNPNFRRPTDPNFDNNANDKYILDIKVSDSTVKCHVDLGSQCSLIKVSAVKELQLDVIEAENLPVLRGIGANLVTPLGIVTCAVEVQGIRETISLYAVEDYVINQPILLGHSFTEKPDIVITKTPTELIFQRILNDKIPLKVSKQTTLPCNTLTPVSVISESRESGTVHVNGSLRGPEGKEYYLLSGQYEINRGCSSLLVFNVSSDPIIIDQDFLLTRANFKQAYSSVLNSCSVAFNETEVDESVNCGKSLDNEERLRLQQLLSKYGDCFSKGLHDLGYTDVTEMVIELEDSQPVVYRPYRMSYAERLLVRNMVQEMLDNGIVRESSSPYASPIVLVQKKTGEKRLCIDYRALNRKTKKDHYPLPRVEDQLDQLSGNTLFTSLDLASGYYQIPIAENSKEKTAFVTPDGQFEYNRMPFGLVNAPSVFQRTINKILSEAKIKYAIVYMDDILIPAKTIDEGLHRLEEVLQLLKKGGLTLKLSKCNFFQNKIDFLGFEVGAEGIRPGSRKTDAVSKFPHPRNQHELRQFLGLSGFFRRFIKGYALITLPLTNLLKKEATWTWSEAQQHAFEEIKTLLTQRPLLALYDPKAETQLHTDASKDGVAGILVQANANRIFQPVSYFSRKTTPDERKFHSYELETLAVVASLNRFRVYLIGIPFKILTDCNALRFTLTKRDVIPRIARWWVQLQEYDCSIEYRPGSRMAHVDALSRNPIEESENASHVLDVLVVDNVDQDWITTVQSADEEIKNIKQVLSDTNSDQIVDFCKNYKLKNGRVYRIVGEELKWLVPKGVRWQILQKNHDDVGHCGFEKTLQRIQQHYWFAKMRRFVKKYVTSCLECAHHKNPGGKREGELHPIEKGSVPFHTIHADHLGPFIKSKSGNCYLLVIVDGFTKYTNIKPVKNTKSATSIRVLKDHISYFGVPTRLITDKGTSFTSKIFKEFVASFGIKHIENAVATPRANGQVERFNRTILNALSTSSHGNDEKNWDEHIIDIQMGLNTTTHKTTQKSPSELLFGFNITCRSQGILSTVINETLNVVSSEDLGEMRQEVNEKIKEQQEKDAQRFNKNRKPGRVYVEGDLVRVERQVPHDGKSQKLVNKYQGPYRIVKQLPNDRYIIEDTPLTRKQGRRYETVVALDKIQPWMIFNRDLESSESESSNSDVED